MRRFYGSSFMHRPKRKILWTRYRRIRLRSFTQDRRPPARHMGKNSQSSIGIIFNELENTRRKSSTPWVFHERRSKDKPAGDTEDFRFASFLQPYGPVLGAK